MVFNAKEVSYDTICKYFKVTLIDNKVKYFDAMGKPLTLKQKEQMLDQLSILLDAYEEGFSNLNRAVKETMERPGKA